MGSFCHSFINSYSLIGQNDRTHLHKKGNTKNRNKSTHVKTELITVPKHSVNKIPIAQLIRYNTVPRDKRVDLKAESGQLNLQHVVLTENQNNINRRN